ncbi:MAG: hypothetical protein H7320_06770 [Ferruginibacter sp.]|nr:hypothetical protein [Ferruginibacter sp.]
MKKILLFIFMTTTFFAHAQNVGIGISSPSEKLEVAGNIKAGNFIYNTPKTFFYTLSGFNFRAEKSTDTILVSIGAGEITMQTNLLGKRIVAPVQLPDGATFVNLKAYINDFSSVTNLEIVLYRKTLTSNFFADNYGLIASSGSAGLALYQTSLFTNVVDNSLYTYYLSVGSENSGIPFPGNIYLRSVTIEYTKTTTQ